MRLDPIRMDKETTVEELLEFYMGKNTPDRQNFIDNLKIEADLIIPFDWYGWNLDFYNKEILNMKVGTVTGMYKTGS